MEEEKQEEKKEENVNKLIELVDRLEKANIESKELLQKQQELIARNLIGGNTDITPPKPEKKEETPQEYAKRILSGKL